MALPVSFLSRCGVDLIASHIYAPLTSLFIMLLLRCAGISFVLTLGAGHAAPNSHSAVKVREQRTLFPSAGFMVVCPKSRAICVAPTTPDSHVIPLFVLLLTTA